MIVYILTPFEWAFATFHCCLWNVDSWSDPWIEETGQPVDGRKWNCSDEGLNWFIKGRKLWSLCFWMLMMWSWYMERGKIITGEYYWSSRSKLAKRKVIFYLESAPASTSSVVATSPHELHFELLPLKSLDLSPRDYFLFPKINKWLTGTKFSSNET